MPPSDSIAQPNAGVCPSTDESHSLVRADSAAVKLDDSASRSPAFDKMSDTSAAPAETEDNAEYKVGYKRPPKHTRFKPGVSGNPRGRQPKRWSAKGEIRRQFLEKLTVQDGNKKVRVPKLTLLVRSLIHKGIKGDTRAALAAYKLAAELRVLELKREIKYDFEALTPEEHKIREQWLEIMNKHYSWNDITEALLELE